jgi:lysophospholipase L1-like esterase
VTTLLAERTNGLIVTVSSNVSHLITVVATYNASGFDTINASVSGATLDNVEQCISLATSKIKTPNTPIGKVILCLGTNDVTRNRDDSDQINITATQAISKIKQTFPKSQIAVCSILPA